ncbi:glycosyltransferase family 4 protein [Lacinutrix neustonica]|uniref:Glycosyltransferase family 4 protein n=1 Tax=Lacinutrix neustonica TaxID=2980107 RepID=A0A9E8SFT9_9FLAO|nr:glycosyltransferase family 4 protein [Lacinutrix neustonica]WAC03784.1 glycosyltransferase family 4 protein [Lacinutrix neustonica]
MENKSQHIVFLTPGFAESEEDSTTIPALQVFLKALRKALPEAKLTLLTFQFPFTKKRYDWHGIEIIPLNGQSKKTKKFWVWKKALNTLKKIHQKDEIETIHSFWIGECSSIGVRFTKEHSINHVVTVMGQDATVVNFHAKNLLHSKVRIVTLSQNHQAELLKTYNLDSIIIPWHLDVDFFPELQKNTIDILGVGSLNTIKNYSDFIKIISTITKTYKNLKVVIIGDGTLRNELQIQIRSLGLMNTITLLGKRSRKDVLEKMAQSNILLHTSHYESFGFVFLEALYSGMQLVSYNVGLAKASQHWNVCHDKLELIEACKSALLKSNKTKNRILMSNRQESITAYLALYHE